MKQNNNRRDFVHFNKFFGKKESAKLTHNNKRKGERKKFKNTIGGGVELIVSWIIRCYKKH